MSSPFSRDMIQGFIDGFIAAGGDPKIATQALSDYMNNHPTYQAPQVEKDSVLNDFATYRLSKKETLAPSTVKVGP